MQFRSISPNKNQYNSQRNEKNSTDTFDRNNTSNFTVDRIDELSKNLKRVVFKSEDESKIRVFRNGLAFMGKHYVVVSRYNKVARYYTIWQSYHSEIYQQYLEIFDSILAGNREFRSIDKIEDLSNETSDSIELFMKFYKQSKNGITNQISQATKEDRFIISGVFGKGLNLEKHNIVGTNLIIVGGTGILPFIDLFAYLARQLISKHLISSQVFQGEVFEDYMDDAKFIIYAYYPDRENSIGLEFTEKISQLLLYSNILKIYNISIWSLHTYN